jgi:PAS domain S-box-containing protein
MKQAPPKTDYRTFRRMVVGVVITLLLLIIGFSTWKAIAEYRLTILAAEHLSRGYVRALKEHVERTLSEADGVTLNIIDYLWVRGDINRLSSQHLRDAMLRQYRNAPQGAEIILVNRDGILFANSTERTFEKQADVSDREYYIHHRNNPDDDTPFISKPVKSRLDGSWRIVMSRPVRSADGAFQGLVGVGFNIEYFQKFYSSLDLGKKGRILMIRKDGALILAEPFNEKDFTSDFRKSALISAYLPLAPKGMYRIEKGKALLENDQRFVAYESLNSYPVVALTNMSMDEVLDSWRSKTILQGAFTVAACLGLFFLMLTLLRQIRRIEEAYSFQAEQQAEIASNKERYRVLVDNLPVVTWQSDQHGATSFISSNVEKIYGYTPDEIYAAGDELWFGRIHKEDSEKVARAFAALFDGSGVYDVEYRIQHKDGHWIWINDFAYTTAMQDGIRLAHGVFSDVTARKRAEEARDQLEMQLRQSQKMDAIGHLAGGIAHDFNNLLTPIMGYAEMVVAKMPAGDPLIPKLAGIITAAHRAKDLTGQLLNFSRRTSTTTEVIDLNDVIRSFHGILQRTIRENITIELKLDPEGSYIKADKAQMGQVVLNLIVNAQDAFSDEGRIIIETCRVLMNAEDVRLHRGMLPGAYVRFTFQDNGCGMSDDVRNHLFEPFFTTKQLGHGTGLGLSTVYGIVRQHDAYIDVTSRESAGTAFRIYFPVHPAPPAIPQLQVNHPVRGKGVGAATILLVEDDEMVREMVREMLEASGFTVCAAAGPKAAIGLFADKSPHIDLLVSDVVMPDMNGPELYEQLVMKIPGLKVIYISGYPITTGSRGVAYAEELLFLQKPFTAEALLERILQVL